jgi:hypothetical protein
MEPKVVLLKLGPINHLKNETSISLLMKCINMVFIFVQMGEFSEFEFTTSFVVYMAYWFIHLPLL